MSEHEETKGTESSGGGMHKEAGQAKTDCACPLCQLRAHIGEAKARESFQHFHTAKLEVLRGIKALVEEGIDWLEKDQPGKEAEPRVTKIEVE